MSSNPFNYTPGQSLDWEALLAEHDWLVAMDGVPQDPQWHAEGDVLTHTKMVMAALLADANFSTLPEPDQRTLVTAALLHDVEKRSTTQRAIVDGSLRTVSPGHAKRGERTARHLLYTKLAVPFAEREAVCGLVRHHGFPLWALGKERPNVAVSKVSQVVNTAHLALLARADVRGRITNDATDMLLRIELFEELCKENECFGSARAFPSDYGRYRYLQGKESAPNYAPYDDRTCTVTLLSGLPGAGKDTYLRRHALDLPVVSIDDLRRENGIKPTDKRGNGQMIQLAKESVRAHLRARRDFAFNATNLTRMMRARWASLFTEYGAAVRIVYVEVPYRRLLRQNASRAAVVPAGVIDRMIFSLEIPEAWEGWELEYFID